MNVEKFNEIFEEQVQRSRETLGFKAKEYATADRLHNFKVAAEYLGMSPNKHVLHSRQSILLVSPICVIMLHTAKPMILVCGTKRSAMQSIICSYLEPSFKKGRKNQFN